MGEPVDKGLIILVFILGMVWLINNELFGKTPHISNFVYKLIGRVKEVKPSE